MKAQFLMHSLALITVIFSIGSDSVDQWVPKITHHYDLGPYMLSLRYRTLEPASGRLMNKKNFKLRLYDRKSTQSVDSIASLDLTSNTKLVACDKLRSTNLDLQNSLFCTSLNSSSSLDESDENQKLDSTNLNPRMTVSIKLRLRALPEVRPSFKFDIYLLKDDHTRKTIMKLGKEAEIERLDALLNDWWIQGNYLQFSWPGGRCSGELDLAINVTETVINSYLDMTAAEFVLANQNGFLLGLNNYACSSDRLGNLFSMIINFIIAKRSEFPYLTIQHSMVSKPLKEIFEYKSSLRQVRHESNSSSYNTNIDISSVSAIFDWINFVLRQTFNHANTNSGSEEMILTLKDYSVTVESEWSSAIRFFKTLSIYDTQVKEGKTRLFNWMLTRNQSDVTFVTTFQREILDQIQQRMIDSWYSIFEGSESTFQNPKTEDVLFGDREKSRSDL